MKMVTSGRADYTLEYDYTVNYLRSRDPSLGVLKVLPIAGFQPVATSVACPRTPWGRSTIEKVDQLLTKVSSNPMYRASLEKWASSESIKRNKSLLNSFFARRAMLTDPSRWDAPR
jgi:uncharacterized protein (TIGR02285 family)